MKGKLIVLDGTDGSGKATQTKLLVERLKKQGHKVETADFPQYGQKSAALVEEYLNGKFGTAEEVGPYRASVFYAVDRYAASFKIREWLNQGKIVVSNRYVSANMGHQAGKIKNLKERDNYLSWIDNLEYDIFKIPRPDAIILLYMTPEIGQKLVDKKGSRTYIGGAKRDIHEADLNHLKNAAEAYQYVAKKYNWVIIDCASNNRLKSIEEIHELVFEKINNILKK
jgi:dTMP kinase